MWLMMTSMKHETVPKVYPNFSKSLFFKVFVAKTSEKNQFGNSNKNMGGRKIGMTFKGIIQCPRGSSEKVRNVEKDNLNVGNTTVDVRCQKNPKQMLKHQPSGRRR